MDSWQPGPQDIQRAIARLQEARTWAVQNATRYFDGIQGELDRIAATDQERGREAREFLVSRAKAPATSSALAFAARFEVHVGPNSGRNIRAAMILCAADSTPDDHYPPFLAEAMREGIIARFSKGQPLVGAQIFASAESERRWEEHQAAERRAAEMMPAWERAWRPPVPDPSWAPGSDRTFGVEIEGYFLDASAPSDQVRRAFDVLQAEGMEPARGTGGPGQWAVRVDGSIRSPAYLIGGQPKGGVEIVSPVLRGREGMAEYVRVSRCLARAGFRSDGMPDVPRPRTCGFHVHVGWPEKGVEALRRLALEWLDREAVMCAGLAPGREDSKSTRSAARVGGERLRAALREAETEKAVIELMSPTRDWSLNLQPLAQPRRARTVEFRARHGWSGGEERWISQCVDMVERAATGGSEEVLAAARERMRLAGMGVEQEGAVPCR